MENLIHADIFFFIASIGFILLGLLGAIVLLYIIRLLRSLVRTMEQIESDIARVGETARELVDDIRDSALLSLILGKKRSRK